MIETVVVGYGLAGRAFHCPLICRQAGLRLRGVVVRDASVRAQAVADWGVRGYPDIDVALADPDVGLVVLATPHDSHAELAVGVLRAGKHCVVDKVMALSVEDADRMIAARDASGRMLSVFHNRRWDWDFLTLKNLLADGRIGRPLLFESAVCRYAAPRTWRGRASEAGTILHDWGAHLVDQALQLGFGPCRRLTAWITPAPWPDVDSGGHGRIVLEFDDHVVFQVETSRICRLDRPRWWVVGSSGGLVKLGIDPQEDALRAGDLSAASEPPEHQSRLRSQSATGEETETVLETVRGSWDAYYANIAEHLESRAPLAVTGEQAREVVRVLDAAIQSSAEHRTIEGPWG
jgi:scyllo-inositol 2-dehydrogenase (NADP+)